MSKILLPQRGILHDRLHEDWVIPLIIRGDEAAARAVVAHIDSIVNNSRAMLVVASSQTIMDAVIDSETALAAVVDSETALAAVIDSETALAAVVDSETAMAAVVDSETALDAVIASSTAMAEVAASETAMAAVFGTSSSPNYTAREKVWNSEIATTAVLGAGRAWLAANVQTESSLSVAGTTWWNYSGSKKALVLQGYYSNATSIRFRYTRAGGETGDYYPGNGFWFDVNIATYNSEVRNNRIGSQTVGVRWVRMQA